LVDMRYKVALITVTSAALLAASSHAHAEPLLVLAQFRGNLDLPAT